MIAIFLGNSEEKSTLMKVFAILDTDNDGKISLEELTLGFTKIMENSAADFEATRLIASFGKRCYGMLDFTSKKKYLRNFSVSYTGNR